MEGKSKVVFESFSIALFRSFEYLMFFFWVFLRFVGFFLDGRGR